MVRKRVRVGGQVQGVGFRPYVYRLAEECTLDGFVLNDGRGATIEVQGTVSAVEAFLKRLAHEAPPPAEVRVEEIEDLEPTEETPFTIRDSLQDSELPRRGDLGAQVTIDTATCPQCLKELFDPKDRRYRYPFINCTHCGPRYTIIQRIPYDRPNTTMAGFKMCPECQREYENPSDRRFHAQPNACGVCGPTVRLFQPDGKPIPSADPIRKAVQLIREGRIVAVKGLGGFHLAVRADRDRGVRTLRARKQRDRKPFALMVRDVAQARSITDITGPAARLLESPVRPIVLAPRLATRKVSYLVAPATNTFGIMLPYTPLHHLLFSEPMPPLVMTSGNLSDEPLAHENDEALARLGGIADAFLMHDRPIERRIDDSVVHLIGGNPAMIRRARGVVPAPTQLPIAAERPILALGAELKNTICLAKGDQAILSEHLGDLKNAVTYRHFVRTIEHLSHFFDAQPRVVVHDRHPEYLSSQYARQLRQGKRIAVQHHHAHIASCMAEHGLDGHVIGLVCDGVGYGTDSTVWGGEVMVADLIRYERLGRIRPMALLGGDKSALQCWWPAAAVLHQCFGEDWQAHADRFDPRILPHAETMLAAEGKQVMSSAMGRLFDAVAFLLDVAKVNHFDAEAPVALEACAENNCRDELPYEIHPGRQNLLELDWRPTIEALTRKRGRIGANHLAAAFHNTLAAMLTQAALHVRRERNLDRVCLTGGVFSNRFLTQRLIERLKEKGFEVYSHTRIPCNDGGVALGQAAIAAARIRP